jgi:hypothetical protein
MAKGWDLLNEKNVLFLYIENSLLNKIYVLLFYQRLINSLPSEKKIFYIIHFNIFELTPWKRKPY